jgi:hypothetical protein
MSVMSPIVPKMIGIAALREAPQIGNLQAFATFMHVPYPTDQSAGPICTHNGSNDAVWFQEVSFWGSRYYQISFTV